MGFGFFQRKGKRLEACQTAGQQPGDGPRGGKRRGAAAGRGSTKDDGLIRAVGVDRCGHAQNTTKMFIAPWSYSQKEIQEKIDKHRNESLRNKSGQMVSGDLMLGDTEGLWGTRFQMDDAGVREEHQRRLGLSEREEARLERILYPNDTCHGDAESPFIRVLGRSRHRCRKSMGAERWKEFIKREKNTLKEHVSMLENKWGRRFVDTCQRCIVDTPLVKRRESKPVQRVHSNLVNERGISVDSQMPRVDTKIDGGIHIVGCSLREKYDLNTGKTNDDSFRILARPTSAA